MLEFPLDNIWFHTGRDHFEPSATSPAEIDLDFEDPLQELSPGHSLSGRL